MKDRHADGRLHGSRRDASADDHRGSDLPTENNRTVNRYVAAGPSLAAFLLAAQVAQQCLVNPEKSALTFSTESDVFLHGESHSSTRLNMTRLTRLQPSFCDSFQCVAGKVSGWTKGTVQRAFYGEKFYPGLPKKRL